MTNTSHDETSMQEQLLATFVLELETASDREAVVADYARRHPLLAEEFEALARAHARVQLAFQPIDVPQPRQYTKGDRLGEFEIVELIAAGGMGEVYAARQPRLDRTVVVKVVRRGRTGPDARRRFDREQRVLARLHQTHIVPIHTAGEDGEAQYFAMAYIRGAALNRVVETVYARETSGSGHTPSLRELATTSPSTAATQSTQRRDGMKRVRLSLDYFRSVADVMAQAAEAVQYAHDEGVRHRDIKPSNLMVDPNGHCWIIDFGLAGLLKGEELAPDASADGGQTCGPMGTPQYMAPEQYDGKPAFASDVWGLGATLYELLTLRRAFDGATYKAIEEQVRTAPPRPVRELVPTAPKDLAAISLKAMAKDAANRYATAGELAADLRRWLNREPTTARPARVLRRVGLWALRNKGWAAAIACAVVAAVTLAVFRNAATNARTAAAEERIKEQERGVILIRSADVRAGVRRNGWSEQAWGLAVDAHRRRPGPDSRDEAASSLVGLDAHLVKRRDTQTLNAGASDVAFSPDGKWVLAGGTGGESTWLWNRETGEENTFREVGEGPVGFRPDGTPVQVVLPTKDRKAIQVRELVAGKMFREIDAPGEPISTAELSADARLLAVATPTVVTVWETTTGMQVRRVEARGAVGLAFAPDGRLLAVGDVEGRVSLWPLPEGDPLPLLACGRTAVRALAFGQALRSPPPDAKDGSKWWLATGDDGGMVTVWDLASRTPVAFCRGSQYEVHSVAFSPDRMHLASAGRFEAKLWEVATGRQLSNLSPPPKARGHMARVMFSPTGSHLAVCSIQGSDVMGGTDVWELQNGRSVRTLRGLAANITRMTLSADGKRVAALSHDWKLAVWDIEANRLLRMLDAPRVFSADNAGLTFSPDGKRFAFSAATEAVMWDLENGRVIDCWKLPPGLTDAIAFHPDGKVYLLRTEVVGGQVPPLSNYPVDKFPRHGAIRELQVGGKLREVSQLAEFSKGGRRVIASQDGRYFVVQWWGATDRTPDVVRAYDSATGAKIWSGWEYAVDFIIDGTGKQILAFTGDGKSAAVVEMPSGKQLGIRQMVGTVLCTNGEHTAAVIEDTERGDRSVTLLRSGTIERLATIDVGVRIRHDGWGGFTPDGRQVVWATEDGTVMVCDIPEVNRRLTGIGAGWSK